jgi:hypothetical protein
LRGGWTGSLLLLVAWLCLEWRRRSLSYDSRNRSCLSRRFVICETVEGKIAGLCLAVCVESNVLPSELTSAFVLETWDSYALSSHAVLS